jgi:hypothetical protein
MIIGRYSSSSDNQNEIVFRHMHPAGEAATRELLQRYRTEAHVEMRKRLGINMLYTDTLGDIVTRVTKKSDKHQGDWILTGDIRVRFPSPRVASTVYDQQRKQHNNRNTQSSQLIGHAGHVCPIIIPTCHSGETSQDDSLHKAYVACPASRGKDHNGIHQLFRDSLREIYDNIFDIDAKPMPIPEDYYTAISNATEAAGEGHTTAMDQNDLLFLFEYYKITKVGGINNPYVYAESPGI